MTPLDESSPGGVVALLLDDLAPPRLGTMLRAARKHGDRTRRDVAGRVGTTPADLRRYERGDTPVPTDLVVALAECYGHDLTDQFATRAPVPFAHQRIVVGDEDLSIEGADDEVLHHYVEIVARLRNGKPGEPISLRANDLVALSAALGQDAEIVEARIAELLDCTPHEARSLHAEMLRRKVILPVAGLLAGVAVVAGFGIAQASPSSSPRPPGGAHAPAPTPHDAAAAMPTTDAAPTAAAAPAPVAHVAAPDSTVETPAPTPAPTPEPSDEMTDATVPEADVQPEVPRPVITPDTTPMSIPGNETHTMIGDPETAP